MNLNIVNKMGLITGLFLVLFGAVIFTTPLHAQMLNNGSADPLGVKYPGASGFSNTDVRFSTARILRIALSMLGIIFVGITLYGGFEWMTSAGNDEKVNQAKKRIYTGIIGLAVILVSYSIASFVITSLTIATR